jgi:hypothetical protein
MRKQVESFHSDPKTPPIRLRDGRYSVVERMSGKGSKTDEL